MRFLLTDWRKVGVDPNLGELYQIDITSMHHYKYDNMSLCVVTLTAPTSYRTEAVIAKHHALLGKHTKYSSIDG